MVDRHKWLTVKLSTIKSAKIGVMNIIIYIINIFDVNIIMIVDNFYIQKVCRI